jgi:hypothetical protein
MTDSASVGHLLDERIVNRIEDLILDAEKARKPLEVDPYRSELFELFVTAEAAGYVAMNPDRDLTADGLCRALSVRWGLADATRQWYEQQSRLEPGHLARMRMLWSVMRMWMEWSYAWQRWPEFHDENRPAPRPRES